MHSTRGRDDLRRAAGNQLPRIKEKKPGTLFAAGESCNMVGSRAARLRFAFYGCFAPQDRAVSIFSGGIYVTSQGYNDWSVVVFYENKVS